MKKIVVATTNKNKVDRIKNLLKNDNYKIFSLSDLIDNNVKEPDEIFETGLDNSIIKSTYYVDYVQEGTIVLSQDDTIELVGISEEDDPKGHIKGPVLAKYGEFTDEIAANYYKDLANKYGGFIPMNFRYGHSVAIKKIDNKTHKKVLGMTSILKTRLVNEIYKLDKRPGYFLSALIEVEIDGKWVKYNDLDDNEIISLDSDLYDSIITMLKEIEEDE